MSRIKKTFQNLKRPALVTFITAGDPDHETSLRLLKSLPAAGADIVELGMPFSDPVADGPVIQLASQRALKAGATMHKTLDLVRAFRRDNSDTPLVLMGYANPVFIYGTEKFAKDAAAAGVDGLIIVDQPPEESAELQNTTRAYGIDLIRLLTPTTDEKRLQTLLNGAGGFLYYVSVTGITGGVRANVQTIMPHINMIKSHTDLPLVIGFGIKTPQDAADMAALADGIVVGSELVRTIADHSQSTDIVEVLQKKVAGLIQKL
jgi:tryptophan synthase alpha chain